MARIFSPEQKAALRSGRVDTAFFLDLFIEPTSLHCSTLWMPITVDVGDGVDQLYEPLADRWTHGEAAITMGTDLTPEPFNITFDASRIDDDSDFLGRLVDSPRWHRRHARFTEFTFVVGSGRATPIAPVFTWEGEIDFADQPETVGVAPVMTYTFESGTMRYLGHNLQTRTDENQQRFFPGDTFFQDLPTLIGRDLPWHRNWTRMQANTSPTPSPPTLFRGKY